MTISNVTTSASGLDSSSDDNASWTHTVTGTPRGIIVLIWVDTDLLTIDAVTYGGTSILANEMSLSPSISSGGEDSRVAAFFLGDNTTLTGDQTVTFTLSGNDNKAGWVVSCDADADMEETDTTVVESLSLQDPTGTLSLGSVTSLCAQVFGTGRTTDDITALTNWTKLGYIEGGADGADCHLYDLVASTDVTIGYTATADDVNILAVAVSEIAAAGAVSSIIPVLQRMPIRHMLVR